MTRWLELDEVRIDNAKDIRNNFVIDKLKATCSPTLLAYLKDKPQKDLKSLVEAADKYEVFGMRANLTARHNIESHRPANEQSTPKRQTDRADSKTKVDFHVMPTPPPLTPYPPDKRPKVSSRLAKAIKNKSAVCYDCGKPGYIKRHCPGNINVTEPNGVPHFDTIINGHLVPVLRVWAGIGSTPKIS